jgi:hypothetical protein
LDTRFAVSNPVDDDGFSRVRKIRSTTSFGEEVKPSVPYRKILHFKDPYNMKEILVGKIHGHFSKTFHTSIPDDYADCCQRALVGESGMIRNQMVRVTDQ